MKIIIVGAGAAGMFCAGFLADAGHKVTVIEHSDLSCKKLLITGKGRCNLTYDYDEETILKNVRTNPKFLYSAIWLFPPNKVKETFENLGVELMP